MKRSDKLLSDAKAELAWGTLILMASVTMGVFAVAVNLSDPSGGTVIALFAAIAFLYALARIRECVRLVNLTEIERRHEWERTPRPRL